MKKVGTKLVTVSLEEAMAYRMTPEQSARFAAIRDEDIVYDEDSPDTSAWPDEGWTRPGPLVPNLAKKSPDASGPDAAPARTIKAG